MIGKFKQMENISREMETIVKKQIEILKLKVQYLKRTIHWKGLQQTAKEKESVNLKTNE